MNLQKATANTILSNKKTNCFLPKIGNKSRMSALTILIQHNTGSPSQPNKARKGNKNHTDWKARTKTVPICR